MTRKARYSKNARVDQPGFIEKSVTLIANPDDTMSKKNQALLFVFLVAAGGAYFAFRSYPATEWIPLTIMGALFFLLGLLIIFLGEHKIEHATPEARKALQKLLAQEAEPYHEKEAPLEDRDIAVLERYVPWTYVGLVFSAIAAALFLGWDEWVILSETTRIVGKVALGFFGGSALLVSSILLLTFTSRVKRIRKRGVKKIIRGIVTGRRVLDTRPALHDARYDQSHGTVNYYLQLGSKEFSLAYKHFIKTTEGDAVEIHYVTDAIGKPLVLHFYLLKKEIVTEA
jgi:hypothetical protein